MELLNLPEGYTQSIEINSPYKAVIDITNSDFNSSLTDLTFSNHFPEEILMQVETIIEIIRPTVTNGFSLTFYEEGETKRVTLNGEDFEDGMKLLNLPNGYTQSVEIKSSNEAVIDITSPSFNSSLASLTFSNHFPEEILMQVETILNSIVNISIIFKDNYQSSSYIDYSYGISTYSQNGNIYAAVTGSAGDEFSIFDITDPTNIIFKDNYQSSTYIDVPRGISTYSQNGNIYATVTGQSGDEFSIFDITDPTNIIFKDNYQSSSYIDSPHDISIYDQNGNIYAAVTGYSGDEFSVFDITDPTNIIFKDNYQSSSYIDGAQGILTYSQNGNIYAAVTGISGDEFSVFDITDPTNIIFKDNYQSSTYIDAPRDVSTYEQNGNMYVVVTGNAGDEFSIFELKPE